MWLVVAATGDPSAARLAACWPSRAVHILTAATLAQEGWAYAPGDALASQLPLGQTRARGADVEAVLVRAECIDPADVPFVIDEDRAFVAAEMTAFLTAWLDELPARMLNRPHPGNLAGPSFLQAQWRQLARRLHIPRASVGLEACAPTASGLPAWGRVWPTATVVGERVFGGVGDTLKERALRLARAAEVALLGVYFDDHGSRGGLVGARTVPDLDAPEVVEAVGRWLAGGDGP